MLRRLVLLAFAALALSLATGCAPTLVPFTQELRAKSGLTDRQIEELQFYVSRRVTLRRELATDGARVTGAHQLVLVSGRRVEEVVVEELTPGVAVAVGPDRVAVSFEPGAALTFSSADAALVDDAAPARFAEPPNPFPGNDAARAEPPMPLSALGAGRYVLRVEPTGSIVYQGKRFDVVDDGGRATLLVDARALERVVTTRKVAPGMTLE